MAFVDNMSITDFKGRVREEARRLTSVGIASGLIDPDPATNVQANFANRSNNTSLNRLFPVQKPNVTCDYPSCGRRGHTRAECYKRIAEEYDTMQAKKAEKSKNSGGGKSSNSNSSKKKGKGRGNQANVANSNPNAHSVVFGGLAYCFKAAVDSGFEYKDGKWIKDCGATQHMHYDKNLFSEYHQLRNKLYVRGIGNGLYVEGVGTIPIVDGYGNVRELKRVLHIPQLKHGLMSLTQLGLEGWTSIINKSGCTFSHGDFRIYSPINNGLCIWDQANPHDLPQQSAAYVTFLSQSTSLNDWHERLGHISKDTLRKYGSKAIDDVDFSSYKDSDESDSTESQLCEPCAYGKQHRLPFKPILKDHRPSNLLELVHSDLCEPNVLSLGGGRYILTFTDGASLNVRIYILSDKKSSTVLKAFKEYQAWVERQSGRKIKGLRTDRGTEYMGDMIAYAKSIGIEHQPTAAYSPQSNGIAERCNRTLLEMVCPMMDAAGAPYELWAEALFAAVYIHNHMPNRSLDGISPFEAWTGQKPKIKHIRKWGCVVYRHINKEVRRKLDPKSMKGYLVGYDSRGIYRVYHPKLKIVKSTRDIIFDESQFINSRRAPGKTETIIFNNDIAQSNSQPCAPQLEPQVTVQQVETKQLSNISKTAPVIYDEIVVEPPPLSVQIPHQSAVPLFKKLNRRTRRTFARAFNAITNGQTSSWKWPKSYWEALQATDSEKWMEAIQKEYNSIMKNETWTLVPRSKHAKVVKSRWVLRIKDCGLYKARFCAKGYSQQWGEDYDETFAPVAKYTSIRTLIALLAGHKRAKLHQMDVNTAFLLSDIQEEVYVEQPEGFVVPGKENHVCLLQKTLYGLKQSPREWFMTMASELVNFEFKQCTADPCIFIHTNESGKKTYIALYVDDLLIAGDSDDDIATIKRLLNERFDMKDLGIAKKFLGMEIEYNDDGSIKIHQNHYIQQLLLRHDMSDCNPVHTPLDTTVKLIASTDKEALADSKEYSSIVGGLMFAACVTRPDIMCAASQLSQFMAKPSSKHLHAAKRVLRYLKGTSLYGITYRPPPMKLTGYSDADWAGDINTRRSTTGYVVMLNNGAVAWKSHRQPTVALSTMEAEYMALTDATKELKWVRTLLAELEYSNSSSSSSNSNSSPIDLFSDNQSAIQLARNGASHSRAKHIDIRHHFVREAIQDKIIWVQYIPTEEMTADSLTKALSREKHERCAVRMGMTH